MHTFCILKAHCSFLYGAIFALISKIDKLENKTTDWLNTSVKPIRSCDTFKFVKFGEYAKNVLKLGYYVPRPYFMKY